MTIKFSGHIARRVSSHLNTGRTFKAIGNDSFSPIVCKENKMSNMRLKILSTSRHFAFPICDF